MNKEVKYKKVHVHKHGGLTTKWGSPCKVLFTNWQTFKEEVKNA